MPSASQRKFHHGTRFRVTGSAWACQSWDETATIVNMGEMVPRKSSDRPTKEIASAFRPGVMTVVTLGNPREKFWGMVLSLTLEGLSISGVDLPSMENVATMVKNGEPFTPAVVFFPMHRVERVEVDGPEGGLPSLTERFLARTGVQPSLLFAAAGRREEPA